jgi:hypothetical protein
LSSTAEKSLDSVHSTEISSFHNIFGQTAPDLKPGDKVPLLLLASTLRAYQMSWKKKNATIDIRTRSPMAARKRTTSPMAARKRTTSPMAARKRTTTEHHRETAEYDTQVSGAGDDCTASSTCMVLSMMEKNAKAVSMGATSRLRYEPHWASMCQKMSAMPHNRTTQFSLVSRSSP